MSKTANLDNIVRVFILAEMEDGTVYEVKAPLSQKKIALHMLTNENTGMIMMSETDYEVFSK